MDRQERIDQFEAEIRKWETEGHALADTLEKADRDPTDAERQQADTLVANIRSTRERINGMKSDRQFMERIEKLNPGGTAKPPVVTRPDVAADDPVLDAKRSVFEAVTRRGGVPFAGEPDAPRMHLGRMVRAIAFGNRKGLSDLEVRALSEGVDSAGGYTVPEVVASSFLDRLRPNLVTMRAGARTVPMTSDTLHIARLAQPGVTPLNWKVENAPITESAIALERVTFTAHTLPCLIKMSIELSEDSVNIDQIIDRELRAALAAELDRVALRGSGTAPEPKGIRFQTGVPLQGSGTDGAALTYDPILDAGFTVLGANVPAENVKVILNARGAKSLAKLKDTQQNYLTPPAAFTAWGPPLVTNAIPNNLTVGTSTDCSEVYVGDFSELLIGVRTTFRIEVSRQAGDATSSAFTNLQLWVRCYLRADVQVGHPDAFCVMTGVRP